MILRNTEEQAAKDDNTAEVSKDDGDTGFGIKISSIASTASENQNDEDTGDKEPAAGFGIKISSIASTASESMEEDKGAKYLGFFSSRSLKTREKCISFAQLVLLSLYIF